MVTCNDILRALTQGTRIYPKGYIYIGYYANRKKYGALKCGCTCDIHRRLQQLVGLKPIAIVEFNDIPLPNLLLMESIVRLRLSEIKGLQHFGNDHFAYKVNNNPTDELKTLVKSNINGWIDEHSQQEYTIHYKA